MMRRMEDWLLLLGSLQATFSVSGRSHAFIAWGLAHALTLQCTMYTGGQGKRWANIIMCRIASRMCGDQHDLEN